MGELLDEILSLDTLRFAFARVRANGGAAGGDRITIARFARHRDAHLFALIDDVRAGSYRAGPVRRIPIVMGSRQRVISILPVRDRVLQRAALDVLTPRVDDRFLPCSFGYRPGLSLHDAVNRMLGLRDEGFLWVLDADIANCFGSFEHHRLLEVVERAVPDEQLCALIQQWISQGIRPNTSRGISLGAPISPLLCNLYLHQLDRGLTGRGYDLVRYADDFVVLCQSERHLDRAARDTIKVLRGLGLHLNAEKTGLTHFDDGFAFLGVWFERHEYSYTVEGKRITLTSIPPDYFHYHADGYE